MSPYNNFCEVTKENGESLDFEFSGLPDEISNDFESTELPEQISKAVLPTTSTSHSTASSQKASAYPSLGCVIFLPTLFGFFLFALLNSIIFRISMGVVASLMLLPGIYLYVVEGCRPEDFKEEEDSNPHTSGSIVFVLAGLSIISFFGGACLSTIFRAFTGTVAALMLLPGLYFYFYFVESCRPEDYKKEEDSNQRTFVSIVFVLAGLSIISFYAGECFSTMFRAFMGTVAALMFLPGMYLYLMDGCRPEDYRGEEEEQTASWKSGGYLVLALFALGSLYGMYASMVFRVLMVTMAGLMFLPGLYLYVVDGCRPEDCEEEYEYASQEHPGVFAGESALSLAIFCSCYAMYNSMVICACMSTLVAILVLPGLYLYVVDGCRPEDNEEEDIGSGNKAAAFVLSLVSLGFCSGMYVSMVFRVCMGTVAALMLIPGLYLYVVEGCRPEDYEEHVISGQKGAGLALSLLSLGSFYGIYVSMILRILTGIVTAVMLLPGLYLYVVAGCRPEDSTEESGFKDD